MAKQGEQIQGKSLDKPLVFKGEDIKVQDIKVNRTPYPLEEHEFFVLTKSSSALKDWQKRLFQIGIGVIITVLSKFVYLFYLFNTAKSPEEKSKIEITIKGWEIVSLILVFGSWFILLIISRFVKSNKDKLISSIDGHFKN